MTMSCRILPDGTMIRIELFHRKLVKLLKITNKIFKHCLSKLLKLVFRKSSGGEGNH